MKTYLFTFSLALLLSMALTPIVIAWAKKRNWVDVPDARKVHRIPVARLGGMAIFAAVMAAILPVLLVRNNVGEQFRTSGMEVVALLLGGMVIFALGLYDDLRRARVRTKLGVEIAVALAICAAGIHIHHITVQGLFSIQFGWLGYLVTVLWIVGITNAMNLIDGLDGLAAGISAIACSVMAVLSIWEGNVILAIIMLALVGSLSGFLLFNFHPAKIFMGDCGSLFLGFMIASVSVLTAAKAEALVGIGLPILVLGIPIFDTFFSILRRFLNRRGIMSPDRSHFHHKLMDLGLKQQHVAIVAYLVTLVVSGLGMVMLLARSTASVLVFLSCLTLLLLAFRLAGSVGLHQTLKGIRQRAELARECHLERQSFEEAQLYFHNVETFDQWWRCLCKAADALGCAKVCIDLASLDNGHRSLMWEKIGNGDTAHMDQEVMHLCIPVSDHRAGQKHRVEIDILTRGSLEGASRRATLLARLAEEQGLGAVPETARPTVLGGSPLATGLVEAGAAGGQPPTANAEFRIPNKADN